MSFEFIAVRLVQALGLGIVAYLFAWCAIFAAEKGVKAFWDVSSNGGVHHLSKGIQEMAEPKTRTVLVKCLVVSTDGFPVGADGEEFSKGYPWYEWEKRRRPVKWLNDPKNKKLWKSVPEK